MSNSTSQARCATWSPSLPTDKPACIFPLLNNTRELVDQCYPISGTSKNPPVVQEIFGDENSQCKYLVIDVDDSTSTVAFRKCVGDDNGGRAISGKISGCSGKLTAEDKKRSGAGRSITMKGSLAMAVMMGVAIVVSL
jgi:hypothetical protein